MSNKVIFKPGDRVLCRGNHITGEYIAVVEKRSASGSSYLVRSEVPLYAVRTHIKGEVKLRHHIGYEPADYVQPLSLIDELAQIFRKPPTCH